MNKDVKREDRYIQPPLCLMQETFNIPERGWNMMLDYGIVNFAKKQQYTMGDVSRQLMYHYYRKQELLQADLYSTMTSFIEEGTLTEDEDYNGFSGPSFFPEESIQELAQLYLSDPSFKDSAILNYQITQAAKFLNIKLGSVDSTIEHHHQGLLYKNNFETIYGPDCCPGIKPLQLIEFRDTSKDADLLRAYIGIKSLIGQNNYVATHKSVILSRMLGCKSNEALTAFLKANKTAQKTFAMYSGRKRMDNLLFKMIEKGFIMVISKKHESRIYISTKIKSPGELADIIIKNREQLNLKKQISEASHRL